MVDKRKDSSKQRELRGYHAPGLPSDAATFEKAHASVRSLQEVQKAQQKKLKPLQAFFIVLVVIFAVAGIYYIAWLNRSVTFQLNGQEVTEKAGTSIQTVIENHHLLPKPGNFVSVSGAVLDAGAGDPFSLTVNGDTLEYSEAKTYTIQDPATLEVGDGANVMESYTLSYKELDPVLSASGSQGALTYISQWPQKGTQEVRTGIVSGDVADGDVVTPAKDAIVTTANIKPANDEKVVALTFNELNAASIQKVLATLSANNAKGTFFMTGESCTQAPSSAKAVVEAGSQVASLSESFEPLNALGPESLQESLNAGFSAAEKSTGVQTTLLRPPYGQFNSQSWLNSDGLVSASVLWNAEAQSASTPESIANAICANVSPGYILLAADGGANVAAELEALPYIIQKLQAQGYRFLTLSELMQTDATIPESIARGDAKMPEGCTWPTGLSAGLAAQTGASASSGTAGATSAGKDESASGGE